MNKTTKGALASGVGVLLLLGGAGTMAFWSDSKTIPGGAINAGHLRIIADGTNKGCDPWKLDSGEDAPVTYSVGDPLVPGDVLTRDCAFTVQAVGDHLRATVGISAVNFTGGNFAGALNASVSDVAIDGTPVTSFTEADDGGKLTAGVTITFDSSSLNGTEDLSTLLNTLTLTATQVHA
jgi:alternate signal-mediated exported protein